MNDLVETTVEELGADRVHLRVDVPSAEIQHAVDHAASDLAASLKVPGFRKGKVPMPVLIARVGKERLYQEAVESHISGWYRNAVAGSRIRPASSPEYDYELPESPETPFHFTATVAVQPKVDVADWAGLEVPIAGSEVPAELVDLELERLRDAVAELAPVEARQAREGDVVVVDLVGSSGDSRRDVVVELGAGRLVEELERELVGMAPGDTKEIAFEVGEEGESQTVTATVNELKEKVLPPLDDGLARASSEFDTLADLRTDIESRLGEQLTAEVEDEFRAAAADALVDASNIEPAEGLVQARANVLLASLVQSLERRGVWSTPTSPSRARLPSRFRSASPARRSGRSRVSSPSKRSPTSSASRLRTPTSRSSSAASWPTRARPTRRWSGCSPTGAASSSARTCACVRPSTASPRT